MVLYVVSDAVIVCLTDWFNIFCVSVGQAYHEDVTSGHNKKPGKVSRPR